MTKKNVPLTREDVKEKALRLLEFRAHSEGELSDKLRRYGADDEDIEYTLGFCRRYGFVNDADYARRKAADLVHLKKYGLRRVRTELRMKGLSEDVIEAAMADFDETVALDTLRELAQKRLREDFSEKSIGKCMNYLAYRGYNYRDIRETISALKEEYGES